MYTKGYIMNIIKGAPKPTWNPYQMKSLWFQLGCTEYIAGKRYLVTFSTGDKANVEYLGIAEDGKHQWKWMEDIIEDTPRFVAHQKEIFSCRDAQDAELLYSVCRMFDDPAFEVKVIKNLIRNFDAVTDPTLLVDIPLIIQELSAIMHEAEEKALTTE
jgi:hypothetical protein